jgi:aminoglycoside N3'-acetyltransferase
MLLRTFRKVRKANESRYFFIGLGQKAERLLEGKQEKRKAGWKRGK